MSADTPESAPTQAEINAASLTFDEDITPEAMKPLFAILRIKYPETEDEVFEAMDKCGRILARAVRGLQAEVEAFKNSNRFHRGHSYGCQEAKDHYEPQLKQARDALAAITSECCSAPRAFSESIEIIRDIASKALAATEQGK